MGCVTAGRFDWSRLSRGADQSYRSGPGYGLGRVSSAGLVGRSLGGDHAGQAQRGADGVLVDFHRDADDRLAMELAELHLQLGVDLLLRLGVYGSPHGDARGAFGDRHGGDQARNVHTV